MILPTRYLARLLRFALFAVALAPAMLRGEDSSTSEPAVRPGDELWLVSTRELGEAGEESGELVLRRYAAEGVERWPVAETEQFTRPLGDATANIIFIHGYGYNEEDAMTAGWLAYRAITSELLPKQHIRFTFFSWPSTAKRFRGIRDFGDKGRRTFSDAWYLAQLLSQLPADQQVTLIGCSYGARVATGAAHYLGGGELRDMKLTEAQVAAKPRLRMLLLAPAVHNDWLYPDQLEDKCLPRTERLLMIFNTRDPVLTEYSRLSRSSDPEALGLSGFLDLDRLGDLKDRVEQLDAFKFIDAHHGLQHYFGSDELMKKVRPFVSWTDKRRD